MPSSRVGVNKSGDGARYTSALMFAPDVRAAMATLILTAVAGCSRPPNVGADLIVTHAAIWTGDASQPSAAAVAVIGDRIVDVGSVDRIDRWRDANTTVLDA
jgi:hypothetical protein